ALHDGEAPLLDEVQVEARRAAAGDRIAGSGDHVAGVDHDVVQLQRPDGMLLELRFELGVIDLEIELVDGLEETRVRVLHPGSCVDASGCPITLFENSLSQKSTTSGRRRALRLLEYRTQERMRAVLLEMRRKPCRDPRTESL